jgi:hypothetical protein
MNLMARYVRTILVIAALLVPVATSAQIMSARRMAMGGATVTRGGPGSDAANVAYRAVPRAPSTGRSLPLPIGLIPLAKDPPVFDYNDPRFNAFELLNLAYDLPWNYPLSKPAAPSSDITIAIGQNDLLVDLGQVKGIFPNGETRMGSEVRSPALVVGIGRAFVGISPLIQYENDIRLNDALDNALAHGQAFVPNTRYEMFARVRAQAAVQGMLGWAQPVWRPDGSDKKNRDGVYVGARAKLLRGIAYADGNPSAAFTTSDSLFGSNPVDIGSSGTTRVADPNGGKLGHGFDAGAVVVIGATELGLALNEIGTTIDWNVKESVFEKDSVSGNYVQKTIAENKPFTSDVPTSAQFTASTRVAGILAAADVERSANDITTWHLGAERWLGNSLALRAGMGLDANKMVETSGGLGLRLGKFGIDLAVATNSRNVTRERTAELGAGFAFYF